jgi:hypothetical protein
MSMHVDALSPSCLGDLLHHAGCARSELLLEVLRHRHRRGRGVRIELIWTMNDLNLVAARKCAESAFETAQSDIAPRTHDV